MEVGSGLGLSGIVAATHSRCITLTDYQEDTLDALKYNVSLNQELEISNGSYTAKNSDVFYEGSSECKLSVKILDWDKLDLVIILNCIAFNITSKVSHYNCI